MTFNAMTERYEEITVCGKHCSPASVSREILSRMVCMPTMSGMMMNAGVSLVKSRPL